MINRRDTVSTGNVAVLCVGCLIAIFALAIPAAAALIHDAAKKGDVPAITAALDGAPMSTRVTAWG